MLINMRKPIVGQPAARDEAKRGFTLTEIAIVLGIVGLILGAIWVAAAAVYNNLRSSKGTTELLNVVQNVRAMYATSGIVDAKADMTVAAKAGLGGPDATYLAAGVFPNDTLNTVDPSQATQALDPWQGTISVQSATSNGGAAGDSFAVIFDNVPAAACINMLTSNVGQGRDPNMLDAEAGAAGAVPGALLAPAPNFAGSAMVKNPATSAQAACNGSATNQYAVGFTFKVK